MQYLENLNQQFAIAGHLDFVQGQGGLLMARINNAQASAEITLQGAHLIGWQPRETAPVIWLSQAARFEQAKSIRGGVPVCWPWFGVHPQDPSLPAHGFARTALWQVATTEALPDGATRIAFTLTHHEKTSPAWPHPYRLHYRISVGHELELELTTENTGNVPFEITEGLHTYFAVGDIEQTEVVGLAGYLYADKTDGMKRKHEAGTVTVRSEVDRVYLDTDGQCHVNDLRLHRRIEISSEGSRSTVVWNPWQAKTAQMDDMRNDGYRTMLCVESVNALDNAVSVAPGTQHSLLARYRLAR